jgi:hypothetical protein
MFDRFSIGRTVRVGAWLIAIVVLCAPARSEARRENPACVAAYKKGQALWKSGRLFEAKETLQKCTKLICSAGLRRECGFRVEQLENDTPTVVLEVIDDRGKPVTNVNVMMDGRPLVSRLDGRAVPVDPGSHEFVFETAGVVFAKEKAIILQGQRNRAISVGLQWQRKSAPARDPAQAQALAAAPPPPPPSARSAPPPPPPPAAPGQSPLEVSGGGPSWGDPADPPPGLPSMSAPLAKAPAQERQTAALSRAGLSRAAEPDPDPVRLRDEPVADGRRAGGPGPSTASYATGSLALAGLAGYGLLTYWGRRDNQQLSECRPNCSQESIDHIKKLYLAANVSAGVGAAALATWVYVTFIASPEGEQAAARTPRYAIGVQPLGAGGVAAVSGSF